MSKISHTRSAIEIRQVSKDNVGNSVQLRVDYSLVPAPDPYYIADFTRVETTGASVQVIFGKLDNPTKTRLRNKLEVIIPAYAFKSQWLNSKAFFDGLKISSEKNSYPPYVPPTTLDEATDKVQTVHSNNCLITSGGSECCIDLYYLSPRDIRYSIEKHGEAHLEPLVRIILESSLLVWLADSFDSIAKVIEPFVVDNTVQEADEVNHEV